MVELDSISDLDPIIIIESTRFDSDVGGYMLGDVGEYMLGDVGEYMVGEVGMIIGLADEDGELYGEDDEINEDRNSSYGFDHSEAEIKK